MALSLSSIGRNLGPRARKLLRYLGFAVLGLVTFVFAFQMTFPFDRVKDKAVDALSAKYDITIGDVERGIIPGRVYFKAVSLRTRPAKAGEVATTFYIEQLEVDLGLFALLRGTIAIKLDARIGSGHIKGKIANSKDNLTVDIDGDDLPSANLPMREVLGLPMSGKVRFTVDLAAPYEKAKTGQIALNWAKANGNVDFACPSGCTVGDGKSKLKLTTNNARNQAFLDEGGGGIDFGKVNIDSLLASVEIKNGKLEITKFDTRSSDGELHIVFTMALNQDIQSSLTTGCLRFRGSDALLKREPKTHAAISTTGAPLGPDNLFHIKLDGPLRQMRRLGQICGPGTNTAMDNPGGTPSRPGLSPEPTRPPALGSIPPPPPPAAPPPAAAPPPPTTGSSGSDAAHGLPSGQMGEGPPPVVIPSPGSAIPPGTAPPAPTQPPPPTAPPSQPPPSGAAPQ